MIQRSRATERPRALKGDRFACHDGAFTGRRERGAPRGLGHTGNVMSSPGSSQVTRSPYGDPLMIASAGTRSCWKCDQPS